MSFLSTGQENIDNNSVAASPAGVALGLGPNAPNTVLGLAILVGLGVVIGLGAAETPTVSGVLLAAIHMSKRSTQGGRRLMADWTETRPSAA
jgi:hypothetical protein